MKRFTTSVWLVVECSQFANFRAVSANTYLPPLSFKEELWLATQDTFDYSDVIFVGGLGMMLLAATHRFLDDRPLSPCMTPLLALGRNALVIFVASQLVTSVLFVTKLPWLAGGRKSLHFWLFDTLFGWIGDRYIASMAWAVALALLFTLVSMLMQRRNIVIRL